MSKITFEIPQNKHPFIGMGEGIIVTENGKMEPKITIKFPKYNIEVDVATGEHIPCNPVYNMLIVVNGTLYQRIHHKMNGGKTYANTDSFAYSEISEEEVTVMKLSGQ